MIFLNINNYFKFFILVFFEFLIIILLKFNIINMIQFILYKVEKINISYQYVKYLLIWNK